MSAKMRFAMLVENGKNEKIFGGKIGKLLFLRLLKKNWGVKQGKNAVGMLWWKGLKSEKKLKIWVEKFVYAVRKIFLWFWRFWG